MLHKLPNELINALYRQLQGSKKLSQQSKLSSFPILQLESTCILLNGRMK